MGPIWDAELRVWDAKNFGLVSPGTHRNKFVKKSLIGTVSLKIDKNLCKQKYELIQVMGVLNLYISYATFDCYDIFIIICLFL